jgi:hypothetical protein
MLSSAMQELVVCKQQSVPGRALNTPPHMSPVEWGESSQSEHNRLNKSHFSLLISVLNFFPRPR